MMKRAWLLFVSFGLFLRVGLAQELSPLNSKPVQLALETELPRNAAGRVEYEQIEEIPTTTGIDLYERAHTWVAKRFIPTQTAIQLADKEAGKLICAGRIAAYMKALGDYYHVGDFLFTLSIDTKDGKYRAVISDITHKANSDRKHSYGVASMGPIENEKTEALAGPSKKQWRAMRSQFSVDVNALLSSLAGAMKSKPKDF